MAKRREGVVWVLVRATAAAMGMYVAATGLLAWLAVRGAVGEEGCRVWLAAVCALSSLVSGLVCRRRLPWSAAVNVLCAAGCFAGVLVGVRVCMGGGGFGVWSGVLLGCAALGGCAAGVLCGKRKRAQTRRGVRR